MDKEIMDPFLIKKVNDAYKRINEGGNIFKDENKVPVTQRIKKVDVDPTLKWLEKILKIDLVNNKLGSTGLTADSGDLDVAINQEEVTKEELVQKLSAWAVKNGQEPKDWVRKSGISVHFKTPIRGNAKNGYVQTDLMFGEPQWMKFAMQGATNSAFKGSHRHILMSSIAKALGLKWSARDGVTSRASGKVISKDPDYIAELLLGPGSTADDFRSVEAMIERIQDFPNYNELVADAQANFARDGLELPSMHMAEDGGYGNELERMLELAGVGSNNSSSVPSMEEASEEAAKKKEMERKYDIEPGTDEWFRLWFSKPKLTGETPHDNW